jgi:hypothetical protein
MERNRGKRAFPIPYHWATSRTRNWQAEFFGLQNHKAARDVQKLWKVAGRKGPVKRLTLVATAGLVNKIRRCNASIHLGGGWLQQVCQFQSIFRQAISSIGAGARGRPLVNPPQAGYGRHAAATWS